VLIGANEEAQKELGVDLPAKRETDNIADIFTQPHLEKETK